ncbi:hypothetical protein [Halomicrococcus sp. SG-WS-1]|uniref:hypothetical protein n=1 Tax=Halomicrococcus sp. SG-WS-1 TaxID=3439057 RepID=UPI003F79AE0A
MALIELNLEKPALKRTERGESNESSEPSVPEESTATDAVDVTEEVESEVDESEVDESEESGGSVIGKLVRRVVVLGGLVAGAFALKKFRGRKGGDAEQQEIEEDWQTAE